MTAEHQEHYYHECLVHPALSSAAKIEKILVIGGGDGGTAKECLLYPAVEQLDLVEIDARVVELSQKYLKNLGGNAWKDKRLNITIEDGIIWAKRAKTNSYDVVLVDGADPEGPAQKLFSKDFFEDCKRIIRPGGIFATQSESPEAFKEIHVNIVKEIRKVFNYADPLYGWVPMYPSGFWSWTFASQDEQRYLKPLPKRVENISNSCEVWSQDWQKGAFQAVPAFIAKELNQ